MKLILAAVAALGLSGPAFAQAGHDMAKMPGMDRPAAAAGAQGAGVIKKLDAKGGSVTLQHGPIAALSWPAMTMAFKADPALLKGLKMGQQVNFTLKTGGTPEVVAIQPK
ncbi:MULTISPECIES: copper-binding protein [Phenylobacterium]|jgi:Cu(I)/Ag(I) efflux system periplasmic protein CusF|uniref:Cu(I)/Ag(I) efflux system protein CusF n=1 Tax=Phenylobacterium haematophilum TaxID=98513 RepID=A0A840A2G0_9CAUL|nr:MULTISPECIES: copper-binding protein [Phenylobacterium]MBB3892806.1 Cu(I)/Ag(I) efflux system protein CusF [Phenylobacterium haematophilum]